MKHFGKKCDLLTNKAEWDAVKEAIPLAISEAEPENIGGQ